MRLGMAGWLEVTFVRVSASSVLPHALTVYFL